jgi:hypothetical protein
MVIFLGEIAHKTQNTQFTMIRATYYCSLFNLEHFCKKKYENPISFDQERPRKTNLKLFDRKNGICQKVVIFLVY